MGSELQIYLDEQLPTHLVVGDGNMLLLRGWAYCPDFPRGTLSVIVDGKSYPVERHSMARVDVFLNQFPSSDKHGYSLFSGFWALVPIRPVSKPCSVPVTLVLSAEDGRTVVKKIGDIQLLPSDRSPLDVAWPEQGKPKVAICMATYNPPAAMFLRQIESLRRQSHTNWICIVTDDSTEDFSPTIIEAIDGDERFVFRRNPERLGFYHNFGRAMSLVPLDADYVALCDQDDRWDEDKLETLISAFSDETQLVYSDCRITDAEGTVYSDTFWYNRRNNFRNLQTLLVANTVTGAASMFRASLLDRILPLPPRVGDAYHDHWIALTAIASGEIGYVDRPLYDYVQHDQNVIGHNYSASHPGFLRYGAAVLRRFPSPGRVIEAAKSVLNQGAISYVYVIRTVLLARLLLIRANPARRKKSILQKYARFSDSLLVPFTEKMWSATQRRPTLNVDGFLLFSSAATDFLTIYHRARRRRFVAPSTTEELRSPSAILADEETFSGANYLTMQRMFFRHPLDGSLS